MSALPILLSIPHGGTRVPEQLQGRVRLTPLQLLYASDAFTHEIYDLGADVVGVVKAEVARACVDLNRAPDARPPSHPEGVVKQVTANGRVVYVEGSEPAPGLVEALISRYFVPYHARLEERLASPGIALALDCHSMANKGLERQRDRGEPRPLFCLSNGNGATCPDDLLRAVGEALQITFACGADEIGYNQPFAGGYITKTYGAGPTPWIQIEMNRRLYLTPDWFDKETLSLDPARARQLRAGFRAALERLGLKGGL